MSDNTVFVKYLGVAPWFESAATGRPAKWMPGQSGYVSAEISQQLAATGMFEVGEHGFVGYRKTLTGWVRKTAGGIPVFGDQVVRCAVLGDSRAANHGYLARTLDVKGVVVWASVLSGGALRLDPSDIYGLGGTMIAQNNVSGLSALNRIGQLAGKNIDVVVTFCDINDALAGRTGEQMFSDKMALTDALLAIGVLPVHLMCVVPNTLAGNAPEKKQIAKYNRLLAARAVIDKRFVLVDTDLRFVDWATGGSVGGASTTSPYYDGLHYGPLSARAIGADVVTALAARGLITNPPPFLMSGPMDLYSADAPYGNRFGSVGTLAGTGGALKDYSDAAGSAAVGVCADGCRLYKDVGNAVTVTGSKSSTTVRGATVTTQKIVISAGGTGDQFVSFALPNGVDYSAGQKYGLGAFFKFTEFAGLKEVGFFCAEYAAPDYNQNYVFSNYDAGTASEILQEALAGELLVPELTLSPGVSALQSRVVFRVDGATADVEVEIALPTLRLIP